MKTLRPIRLLAGLGVLAASLAFIAAPGARAVDVLGTEVALTDMTVSLASLPAEVLPPGDLVLIQATVSDTIPAAVAMLGGGTLTVDLALGSAYRDDLSSAACAAVDGDTAECTVPGGGGVFDIVGHTPLTVGDATTNATITATGPLAPFEDGSNNTATVTTAVTAAGEGIAAGLVEEGESLSLVVGDGREFVLTVPEGVPGVIATVRTYQPTEADDCGGVPCRPGFHADFAQHPTYKALDPTNPLITNQTFGSQDPCVGFGAPCTDVYTAHAPGDPLYKMPYCAGASGGGAGSGQALPDSPCINEKYRESPAKDKAKARAELSRIFFDIRMLSNDPISVPPLL